MTSNGAPQRSLFRSPFGPILWVWLGVGIIFAMVIAAVGSLGWKDWTVEAYFFRSQDAPVLAGCLALIVALGLAPTAALAALWGRLRLSPRLGVALLAALVLIAGAAGVSLVFFNDTFSLDEFLANFDAQIIATGRLVAHVPDDWQEYTSAMQPMYMLPLTDDAWASSYLPVNAALRALGLLLHGERWVNPLLSAFSVVAVYAVGRRIWPDRPTIATIAAVLLGTSSQLIVMSMTAYAMPGHLAFNLAWLWLFLRGGRLGHAGAIVVGFLATGLHQLLFHPIFVAPFVLQLWFHRRWGLAALYTLAYAAICGFWVEYWPLMEAVSHATPEIGSTGGAFFLDRIADSFDKLQWRNLGVMAECLIRFVAWQNPLTASLALIGAALTIRTRGYVRPMALGVLLTLLAVFFATPTQTHGWGYRYLEGLMGSICLLAAWAWTRLTDRGDAPRRAAASGGLIAASAISLLLLAPLHAWQARAFVRPYAAANAAIQSAPADVVVIDHDSDVLFDKGTVTHNDPFLRRSPKVMSLSDMDYEMTRDLCASERVLVFNGQSAQAYGIQTIPWNGDLGIAQLRAYMRRLGCYKPLLPARPA